MKVNSSNPPVSIFPEADVATQAERASLFRQGAWMVVAAVVSGLVNLLVHVFSKLISPAEYATLGVLLQIFNWMMIPALGLQMVFTQQAAGAVTGEQKRQLAGAMRAVARGAFGAWVLLTVLVVLWRDQLVAGLRIANPMALWITLAIALLMFWSPIFAGIMQGRQNFLWLGWAAILNSFGRLFLSAVIVFWMARSAVGIMTGALAGTAVAFGITLWQTRELWDDPGAGVCWRPWLARVVPLTAAFGASQFLLGADLLVVQANLGDGGQAAPYVFGSALARAMVVSISPLAGVMFPKLVHSAAQAKKTNVLAMTMLGTAVLSAAAAGALSFFAPLIIQWGSRPEYLSIVPLIPLFAWSMVPLALANVLLNSLMAHSRFEVVPPLVLVAVGYWIALHYYHDSFKIIIQTLGWFNLLFLAVCLWFAWRSRE